MPSGWGSSSHHFQTSCSSSFFLRPPLAGDPLVAAVAPFLGEGLALEAPPFFFFIGVVGTVGVAAGVDLIFDEEVADFLDFFGCKGRRKNIKRTRTCTYAERYF